MNRFVFVELACLLLAGVAFSAAGPTLSSPPMGKKFAAAEKSNCGTTAEVTEGLYYVLGTTEFKDDNVNITNPQ